MINDKGDDDQYILEPGPNIWFIGFIMGCIPPIIG